MGVPLKPSGNSLAATYVEIKISRRAIDATPARWRGDAGSSPLDGASTAASSPRNDLVHPTHWLISTQVAAKEFPENFKGTPMLSCSVTPGRTYAPCAYFTTHGLWLGRSETA